MKESNTLRRVSRRVSPARRRRPITSKPLVRLATPESAAITLRKSAHRYRGIIEKLPVAFYLCDYEGKIVLANECAEVLWGRKPQIGVDSWCGSWRIYLPDGRELPLEACPMAVALREGRSIRGEELIVERPDGGRSWVIPHPDPIFDEDGALAGATNVLVDITPQREAEYLLRRSHEELEQRVNERTAALAHSQRRLSLAQQASSSGMWDWDAASDELFTTAEFRQLFEYHDGQRINWEAWMGLIHPDDRETVKQQMHTLFESGRELDLEYRLLSPDRGERWIGARGTLARDAEGRPARLTGISMDITARKVAEARIRWKAHMLQLSHDAITVWDTDERLTYWNRGSSDVYGYPSDEALGQPIHDLLQTRFPFPKAFVEEELRRSGRWAGEVHQVTKDGRDLILSCRLQLLTCAGSRDLTLGTFRDVTHRKRLEQGIMNAALHEQQRIAQDLHDSICQELAGTEVLTRVLKVKIGPNAAALADLETISTNLREAIDHTRMLVQGLSPVSPHPQGLMDAIQQLCAHTRQLHRVDCVYEREQSVEVPDNARATHLLRIVQEAISNAVRHGRARKIRIRLTQTGSTGVLAIHDDGVGIPLEVATTSGMGLHTMRHRAESIGGTLQVRRGGVKGTVVVCTFSPSG